MNDVIATLLVQIVATCFLIKRCRSSREISGTSISPQETYLILFYLIMVVKLWRTADKSIVITSDKGGCKCFARVRLSVCLLGRLLKNVRGFGCCVSTDVETWTNWIEPDPDHSPDAGTALLSPISYRLRNFSALRMLPASSIRKQKQRLIEFG